MRIRYKQTDPRAGTVIEVNDVNGASIVARGGGYDLATNALGAIKHAIMSESADVHVLFIGDSTADEAHASAAAGQKLPYRFAKMLATKYPSHSVEFRGWVDATPAYGAAEVVATGYGSRKITIWNASIGGTQPVYLMGSKFAAAIGDVNANAVIFQHGHNATEALGAEAIEGQWIAAIEMVQLAKPGVPIAVITQNPLRDDTTYSVKYARWQGIYNRKDGLTLIDTNARFIAAGKPAGWYADNVHPGAAGQSVMLDVLTDEMEAVNSAPFIMPPAWLSENGPNLLTNGDFSDWTGANPAGWIAGGTPTILKDTTIKDAGRAYSLKITNSTAQTQRLYQSMASWQAYVGKTLTLAVRHRLDSANGANAFACARAQVQLTGAVNKSTYPHTGPYDAWIWSVLTFVVPSDATGITTSLYASTSATSGLFGHYDQAVLVEGAFPRKMA